MLAQAQEVSFPTSAFVPLAIGFFALGTGYLIYGPQELLRVPGRSRAVDLCHRLANSGASSCIAFEECSARAR